MLYIIYTDRGSRRTYTVGNTVGNIINNIKGIMLKQRGIISYY